MALRISVILGFLALVLPLVSASHWSRRHHQEVALRARGDVDIHKRDAFTNARFTFYDVGLGACGQYNVASDWIVALNVEQYGGGYPGPQCFKQITIQYGGQTAVATIMDECMGCPYGGLDFSRGLFDFFASEGLGVLSGTWWFNDDSGGGGAAPTTSSWDLLPLGNHLHPRLHQPHGSHPHHHPLLLGNHPHPHRPRPLLRALQPIPPLLPQLLPARPPRLHQPRLRSTSVLAWLAGWLSQLVQLCLPLRREAHRTFLLLITFLSRLALRFPPPRKTCRCG